MTLKEITSRLAAKKWRDFDTYREEQSHLAEYKRDGTAKNLVDAAIIASIRSQIAARRAAALFRRYQEATGKDPKEILEQRLGKFMQYENVPFPAGQNGPPADPWKEDV